MILNYMNDEKFDLVFNLLHSIRTLQIETKNQQGIQIDAVA
jgi:hypothetical protein